VTSQLPLALRLRPSQRLEDFVVGRNRQALAALRALLAAPGPAQLYLSGPPGVGKSHLLAGLCSAAEGQGLSVAYVPLAEAAQLAPELLQGLEAMDLLAIDDVQCIAGKPSWEQALFALYNSARDAGRRLVVTADCGPAKLPMTLPDLRSRLAWGEAYHLQPLSDQDKIQLLEGQATQRGLQLPPEVGRYILDRAPRDLPSLLALMEQLDHAALAAQRRLTIPFVREQLRKSD
jgi:DnaA family protein